MGGSGGGGGGGVQQQCGALVWCGVSTSVDCCSVVVWYGVVVWCGGTPQCQHRSAHCRMRQNVHVQRCAPAQRPAALNRRQQCGTGVCSRLGWAALLLLPLGSACRGSACKGGYMCTPTVHASSPSSICRALK